LVPDQRIGAGPARDLLANPDLAERLLEQPAALSVVPPTASPRASELLVFRTLPPGSDVIARLPGSGASTASSSPAPVVVSSPRGDGRLVVSGAMDAWRFRAADNSSFDRFWQSTVAGLALGVPPPIAVSVNPPIAAPGERVGITVRVRSPQAGGVSATYENDQPIRLVPDPEPGVYRGSAVASDTAGRGRVLARAGNGPEAAATLVVQAHAERLQPAAGPTLALLASSHRGIDVTPEHLDTLQQFLRSSVAAPPIRVARHPMRSTWWILPFVACLSVEWWIRRRRGQR
jgi:hypothetical protein